MVMINIILIVVTVLSSAVVTNMFLQHVTWQLSSMLPCAKWAGVGGVLTRAVGRM